MGKYIVVRTIWIFIIITIILSLNFVLLKLAPEFPPPTEEQKDVYYNRQVADGYMTMRTTKDPAEITAIIAKIANNDRGDCPKCFYREEQDGEQYRIYEPVPVALQYVRWLFNVIPHFEDDVCTVQETNTADHECYGLEEGDKVGIQLVSDWGLSTRLKVNKPAFSVLSKRIPVTLKLNLVALFFYIPIGFTLGIVAALRKNSLTDNIITLGVMIFISVPSFVVMTILVMFFGYNLDWLPPQYPAADVSGSIQFWALVLPVFGLSFGAIAGLTRTTRAELTEVLTSEFVLLARTKGLTRTQAVIRHAMRNSMVPLVPGIIGSFVGLLSGSVIIERIYGIPGTGSVFIEAMREGARDYNVILAISAFYTIIGLFAVLLVDLSYGIVDPRIRMGARK